ncbi:MAG: hypothetical protein LC737_03350, partial [Chloroflexi bacterium]|nr:hypothetical protein [Chloroflexota bacterium]
MRARWLLLVVALCVPAVVPLLTLPFIATDDGLFHLYRLAALDYAVRHGDVYPRIFPSFAFGYGQPVLSYYGPLSYYVAEFLHLLGASFPDALKWTFVLGYVASGYAMFLLATEFVPAWPALLAATAYVYFPYHLADVYQRGALAEHLAFVFLPLVLWAFSPAQIAKRRSRIVGVLGLAALVLTHTLTTMIFLPFVIVYALVLAD